VVEEEANEEEAEVLSDKQLRQKQNNLNKKVCFFSFLTIMFEEYSI
jgi:hypothetical protein